MRDLTSTQVIEGLPLLTFTFTIAITTVGLVNAQITVFSSPCTIARRVSLLAESELLLVIPPGSEWYDKAELRKRGVHKGFLYHLVCGSRGIAKEGTAGY